MKTFGIIGTSLLGKAPFAERLIEAYRFDGHSVSVIKHAPDGFDLDQPGKASLARREAGAREVMLVGDRRLVLMNEYGSGREPALGALLERLDPVDLVIVEGYHAAPIPTLEFYRPNAKRAPHYTENRHVVAVVSDEPLDLALPCFGVDDIGGIASFMAATIGLCAPPARQHDARRAAGH